MSANARARRAARAAAEAAANQSAPVPEEAPELGTDTTRPLVVFDLDGVLADVRHRLRHVEGRRRDWNRFFDESPKDALLAAGLAKLEELAHENEIVILTGRPSSEIHRTRAWLAAHGLDHLPLMMRTGGDRSPAFEFKARRIEELRTQGREIALVVDDDAKVINTLKAAGLPTLHARWMRSAPRNT